MSRPLKISLILFCSILIIPVICVFYGHQLAMEQTGIRVWEWFDFFILLIALPFIFLQSKSGLPELWQPAISNRQRILIPLFTGIIFGLLDILVVKVIMHPEPYETMPPFLQPFPYSLLLYTSGALEIEVFYRLVPITLVMLVIGKMLLKGKYDGNVFLVIAVLTALREPLEQWQSEPVWFMLYALLTGFAMNFLQAIYYRKAGFLATLFVRLGHYLFWHILLGLYVEFMEL